VCLKSACIAGFSKIAMIFEKICWIAVSHSDDAQKRQVAQRFLKSTRQDRVEKTQESYMRSASRDFLKSQNLRRFRLYLFAPPDKKRPVVVLTRDNAIDYLSTVTVAPITSAIRGVPSEVVLNEDDGMKTPCAVNLHNSVTVS
jgi:PemK-like, MazF-like toxin of type II toxin-antitoxin system